MKVATVGGVVRTYRKASGISQKDLAAMVGMSRATLNYLESGRDIEIGAGKLLSLLAVLAVPFVLPTDIDVSADEGAVDNALKTLKGSKRMTRKVLVEALTTGRVPIGLDKELTQVIDSTPDPVVFAMVRVVGVGAGLSGQAVRKNARSLAKAVGSSNKAWLHGG
jgi:transcriptional regulator with XRE-family HTH domain